VNIVLHGGEPLLAGPKRAASICDAILEELEGIIDVSFAVQTNGVLINEQWIKFFKDYRVKVGVSLDGLPEVHNKMRPDHKGRGSFDDCIRGFRLVEESFAEDVEMRCGVLGVIHNSDNEDKMLEYMIDELGATSPNLNFPRDGWDSADAVKFGQSVENHRKLMRSYLDNYVHPDFSFVRGLSGVLFSLMSDVGAKKNDLSASCKHYIATISSEGDVYVDDNLLCLNEEFGKDILDIFGDSSLLDLVESDHWQELNTALDAVPEDCHECEWKRSCRSGDLFNRFSKEQRFNNKSVLCDTIKMFHEEAASFLVNSGVCTTEQLAERLSTESEYSADSCFRALTRKEKI
jgi:uncharacterized protein